jgi:6-phosphogluconolactonase
LVAATFVEKLRAHRLTLTLPAINAARSVIFLVAGEAKAETLRAVLEGEKRARPLPSQLVEPTEGELIWLVDEAAAKALTL